MVVVCFQAQAAAKDEAREWSGKAVAVKDGDTIGVLKEGKEVSVRLYGIDCPEKKQAFGMKAKQFASDLVFGKTVTIKVKGRDRYKRTIGIVVLPDGRILNHELIKAGLAWWYEKYAPKDSELQKLERHARAKHLGLWSDVNPIPPWKYRKQTKALRRINFNREAK